MRRVRRQVSRSRQPATAVDRARDESAPGWPQPAPCEAAADEKRTPEIHAAIGSRRGIALLARREKGRGSQAVRQTPSRQEVKTMIREPWAEAPRHRKASNRMAVAGRSPRKAAFVVSCPLSQCCMVIPIPNSTAGPASIAWATSVRPGLGFAAFFPSQGSSSPPRSPRWGAGGEIDLNRA